MTWTTLVTAGPAGTTHDTVTWEIRPYQLHGTACVRTANDWE